MDMIGISKDSQGSGIVYGTFTRTVAGHRSLLGSSIREGPPDRLNSFDSLQVWYRRARLLLGLAAVVLTGWRLKAFHFEPLPSAFWETLHRPCTSPKLF